MNADSFKYKDITDTILKCFFYEVYNELGSGFIESVYEKSLSIALIQAGARAENQREVTVFFRGTPVGTFRTAIVVDGKSHHRNKSRAGYRERP